MRASAAATTPSFSMSAMLHVLQVNDMPEMQW
jgi:hypothetical protein